MIAMLVPEALQKGDIGSGSCGDKILWQTAVSIIVCRQAAKIGRTDAVALILVARAVGEGDATTTKSD